MAAGTDHAGIATQALVEKVLNQKILTKIKLEEKNLLKKFGVEGRVWRKIIKQLKNLDVHVTGPEMHLLWIRIIEVCIKSIYRFIQKKDNL